MAEGADPFEIWTVATFNVVTVGLVGLLVGYRAGVLTNSLPSFGSLPGVAIFGYLWLLTLGTTRWALAAGSLEQLYAEGVQTVLVRGAVAGGLTGMVFVGGISLIGGIVGVLRGGPTLAAVGLIVAIGAGVATVVGLVLGAASTLLTIGLFRMTGVVLDDQCHE